MATVRFIADLHLGHTNLALHRGFSTVEEHDEYVIEKYNSVVHKRDVTYILGDITMENSKSYHLLDRLNGIKHVVMGNHDRRQDVKKLLEHVDSVTGAIMYKGIFLTHIPVHPMELDYRVKRNIHGHIHEKFVERDFKLFGISMFKRVDRRYQCVSCEQVDYTPKTLEELGIHR